MSFDPYGVSTISYTFQNLQMDEDKKENTNDQLINAFYKFIKDFKLDGIYKYRDQLQVNIQKSIFKMEFDLEDLNSFNSDLGNFLNNYPAVAIPLFEESIKKVYFEIVQASSDITYEEVPDFQFILNSKEDPRNIRSLDSTTVHKMITISGIIVSASKSQIKTSNCVVQCRNCGNIKRIKVNGGFEQIQIPRVCESAKNLPAESKEKCPLDSYIIVPEKSKYIDVQTLKIQEAPELIPVGEIPRTYLLYCDRYLVNKVTPGTRLTVIGIQCVDERKFQGASNTTEKGSYIRVIQFIPETKKTGRQEFKYTEDDEAKFDRFSKDKKIYQKISKSIAPAIYGCEDIKKAVACLLFGGCRKKLPEGVNLRGDINILLLGDPSTAKSQFLKFVERAAPIAVYTSGKGSSAAGLTASIIKDPSTGEFQLEGGAMVLADGGIVCIDEFDKMRAQDRVAIHEAMEQQTISVAKAGITTTLNSRTSVLAAANPVLGHIDDLKTTQEQIDFQTTILSRFDCIFLVKDYHDNERDKQMAEHIVAINAAGNVGERTVEGEIPIADLKKYIAYAREKCVPKLTEESGEELKNFYVKDRKEADNNKSKKGNDIPVTVRQLEAIIRLSEAIAKMSLSNTVTKEHVKEAHRLFQISTLYAAGSRMAMTFEIPRENIKDVVKIEESIKRKLPVGQKINYDKLVEELVGGNAVQKFVQCAIINLVRTGQLQFSEERKILTRKK